MKKTLLFAFLLLSIGITAQTTIYANINVSGGNNDGTSWANAYSNLQDALTNSSSGDQIWVAAGTYTPGTLETDSFTIPSNVTVLGGFNATETTANERNWATNPTILSGDLNNSLTENPGDSHTIVTMIGNNAEINGVYIQWGYADDLSENSPTFIGRTGAGVYNNGNNKIFNCSIRSNYAVVGAGLVSYGGTLEIINTLFNSNTANNNGGAMSAENGTINITNCTITDNNAINGGGIHFYNGSINATNTIFTNNSGTNGNINDDGPGTGTANYCLFYNGTSGNNGNLPPNITGSNNIENTDPIYASNYKLNYNSPAIETASNTAYTNAGGDLNNDLDLAGNPRKNNSSIDIGANEFQKLLLVPDSNNTLYVNKNVSGGTSDGSSWANAVLELSDLLIWVKQNESNWTSTNPLQIWVAKGTYIPGGLETDSFVIPSNVSVLGGFNGTETTANERNWGTNPTILSGDLNNSLTENPGDSHTIVTMVGDNIELNGFSVQWGYADNAYDDSITAIGRSGAGVYNNGNNKIYNCKIRSNAAMATGQYQVGVGVGGGLISFGGTLDILNTIFHFNSSSAVGGAISAEDGTINITNCTIADNKADINLVGNKAGGGIHFYNGNINAYNTIFSNNSGDNGNINNGGGSGVGTANYCSFFNLTSGNNGDLPPGVTGDNNLTNTYPFFINNEFHLSAYSPVANAGDNTAYINANGNLTNDMDLEGHPRLYKSTIDIGAYELQQDPITITPNANNVLYVNKNTSSSNGSGDSWENAIPELADALLWARTNYKSSWTSVPLQIWVAGGTYKPLYSPRDDNFGSDQGTENSFLLAKDVQLYGSFAGNETSLTDRDLSITNNITTLSGDINNNDELIIPVPDSGAIFTPATMVGNAYHVVIGTNDLGDAVLNGFVITGGNAIGSSNIEKKVNGVHVSDNDGAGLYLVSNSLLLKNVAVVSNSAHGTYGDGGGIYLSVYYGIPNTTSLLNVIISRNTASQGGGIYFGSCSPYVSNITMIGNKAIVEGDEIYNFYASPNITNSIIWGLNANSIVNSNPTYSYSIIKNNTDTYNNNIDTSGLTEYDIFVDPDKFDLRLSSSSPAIDAGSNQAYMNVRENSVSDIDLAGNRRISNYTIDIGAYEFQSPCEFTEAIVYVDKNAVGDNDGSSWTNAYTELSSALNLATNCSTITEIWVAEGSYTPGILETDSFTIPNNVTVLGGFNGTETTANERNWATNPTILSGDLNGDQTPNEGDSHTIVTMIESNAEINGFYIQGGFADNAGDNALPNIGRAGAGVYNNGNNKIYNCVIRNNIADTPDSPEIGIGAGLVSFGGILEVVNTLFNSNTASANGGAISAESGAINITNCTIADNNANKGGGIHFYIGNINAVNTIFSNNSGTNGNINNDGGAGTGTANYCLFYNTTTDNNGNLPPNITGNNNIENTDPIFINGYEIANSSSAMNAGDNTAYTNANGDLNNDLDLAGTPRLHGYSIDLGAYESSPTLYTETINTVAFTVYPNPVNDILNIKTLHQKYNYGIYNLQGQLILENRNQTSNTIDVSKLPSGVYILKMTNNNKFQSFKIIKE